MIIQVRVVAAAAAILLAAQGTLAQYNDTVVPVFDYGKTLGEPYYIWNQVSNNVAGQLCDQINRLSGSERAGNPLYSSSAECEPPPEDPCRGNKTCAASLARVRSSFSQPLDRAAYRERNWSWIRCRSGYSNFYDVGGNWVADHGEAWRRELAVEPGCTGIQKWGFSYYNEQGWGDGHASLRPTGETCGQSRVVAAARHVADRLATEGDRAKLYIWNCYGHEDADNFAWEKGLKPQPWYGL